MAEPTNQSFLNSERARSMAEVSHSPLQQHKISSRWLLKVLPWVDVTSGIYQINRSEKNAPIYCAAGHDEEHVLPQNAAIQELEPRQYDLNVTQTILRLHSRVVDLYNKPHDQTAEQIRLAVERLREQQEDEMINNPDFGLLSSACLSQRLKSANNRPTPDALDDLISRRRNTQFLFAHPRTIAAFGKECNQRGLIIQNIPLGDNLVPSWRGIPLLSCNKIPVKDDTSSIIAIRTGEDNEGVIGLRPATLPDQYDPGVNIRFMGINEQAIISYLINAYFSIAVLVPSALGILEDVEIGHQDDKCHPDEA